MDEMRDARIRRLSPEARELLEELERRMAEESQRRQVAGEQPRTLEELIGDLGPRLDALSTQDRAVLDTLMAVTPLAAERAANQDAADVTTAQRAMSLIERAVRLDRAEGKPVREDMPLGEAVERLRRAGEITAEEERFYEAVKHRQVPRTDVSMTEGNEAEEYVFIVGQERREGKPLVPVADNSVFAFDSEEDARRYLQQLEGAPVDAGVLRVSMSGLLEFAREYGLLVEVVEPGDDYPTTIIRP
jgi:Protein of unknown function (DUF3110)